MKNDVEDYLLDLMDENGRPPDFELIDEILGQVVHIAKQRELLA